MDDIKIETDGNGNGDGDDKDCEIKIVNVKGAEAAAPPASAMEVEVDPPDPGPATVPTGGEGGDQDQKGGESSEPKTVSTTPGETQVGAVGDEQESAAAAVEVGVGDGYVVEEEIDGADSEDDEGKEKKKDGESSTGAATAKDNSTEVDGAAPPITEIKNENEMAEKSTKSSIEKETESSQGPNDTDGTKEKDVILMNPLFGKPGDSVPVIDLGESSGSEDGEDENFSTDVDINTFNQFGGLNAQQGEETSNQTGQSCNCNCYQEKGILVNEIERLRKAIVDVSERQSILEDYIEVEYSDNFERYLKNRGHLLDMGFGQNDLDKYGKKTKTADGKRKSSELVELLKMIKEQAAANVTSGSSDTTSKHSPPRDPPKSKAVLSNINNNSKSSASTSQSKSHQSHSSPAQKPKKNKTKNSSTTQPQSNYSSRSSLSMAKPKPSQFAPPRSSSSGPPAKISRDASYSQHQVQRSGGGSSSAAQTQPQGDFHKPPAVARQPPPPPIISSNPPRSMPMPFSQQQQQQQQIQSGRVGTVGRASGPLMPVPMPSAQDKFMMQQQQQQQQQNNANRQPEVVGAIGRSNLSSAPSNPGVTYNYDSYYNYNLGSQPQPLLRSQPQQSQGQGPIQPLGGGGGHFNEGEGKARRKRKRKSGSEISSAAANSSAMSMSGGQGQARLVQGQGQPQQALVKNPLALSNKSIPVQLGKQQQNQSQNAGGGSGGGGINNDPNMNPITKRVCPMPHCGKVVNRKALREHILAMHQGFKIKCRDCDEEFSQKKRLKVHMRDVHGTLPAEWANYVSNTCSSYMIQCGPWLDKMCMTSLIPNQKQMMEYRKEVEAQRVARFQQSQFQGDFAEMADGSLKTSQIQSSVPGSYNTTNTMQMPNIPGSAPGCYSSNTRYPAPAPQSLGPPLAPPPQDMYGPGGYAQYAARYLQQGRQPGNNLYTSF